MRSAARRACLSVFALGALPFAASACCGPPPTIAFAVTPSAKQAVNDGNTPTEVTATLVLGGSPVPDGTQVTFNVDPSTNASLAPIAIGQTAVQSVQAQTSSGKATVQVFDLAVEQVMVSAGAQVTFQGATSSTPTPMNGEVTIKFGGACSDSFVTAHDDSSGNQAGVATYISLQCDWATMGGSFDWESNHPFEGNTQSCTAFVGDGPNQGVANAPVQFITEAGAFETAVQKAGQHATWLTNTGGEATLNYHVQPPYPEDVGYDQTLDGMFQDTNQPRQWTDQTNHTYNPRDGWVTMVAAAVGKPPVDPPPTPSAANGPVVQCLSSAQCPEPYVDSNDNGQWDPGEPYIDVNCNGQFDQQQTPDSNGYVRIWASTKILWTGQIYPNRGDTVDPASVGIASGEIQQLETPAAACGLLPFGGSCQLTFRFVDKNLNLPSTQGSGNQVQFTVNAGSGCSVSGGTTTPADIQYEQLVVVPDFQFSFANSTAPPGQGRQNTLSATAAGTFNFCDPNNQANSTLEKVDSLTVGEGFSGFCQY